MNTNLVLEDTDVEKGNSSKKKRENHFFFGRLVRLYEYNMNVLQSRKEVQLCLGLDSRCVPAIGLPVIRSFTRAVRLEQGVPRAGLRI